MPRHKWWALSLGAALASACRPSAGTASSPANPSPVDAPVRPAQAPIVTIQRIMKGEVATGQRVRVTGRCLEAASGRSAGLWTLASDSAQIDVRGLVPKPCPTKLGQTVTIFAQVEWQTSSGPDRLLLRLPGQ